MTHRLMNCLLAAGGLVFAFGIDATAQDVILSAPPADATDSPPDAIVPPPKLVPSPVLPPAPGPATPLPKTDAPEVIREPFVPREQSVRPAPVTVAPYYVPNQRHIRYLPESVVPGTTGGLHLRYPYYSYRRPWYRPGPASVNVTIIW
ncbi:MAG: hypothetical protein DWQ29_15585 [Planctomycetota bacterium]|nr:MAG: hypothetical protein DWQ29_15585 [Planctomycetota bacterium]